mgnify:CR=1 FL=1
MRSKFGFAAMIAITAMGLAAYGGKEPPPPPPVVDETTAVPDADSLAAAELARMGKELKRLCGSGGTVKDGVVEIQGDHRDRVVAWLAERGYEVKRAGG